MKLFWLTALLAAAVDLLSKHYIFAWLRGVPQAEYVIIPDGLRFTLHINSGALWGLGGETPTLLLLFTALIIPCVVFAAYTCKDPTAPRWALGLILGGAIGNFYDRVFTEEILWYADEPLRGVRDFISMAIPDVYSWPVYNVADIAIVIGVGGFALHNLRLK